MLNRLFLSFAWVSVSAGSAFSQRDCVLKKDKDSIKVYSCASDYSKFKSIRAIFTVNARLSQFAAFVLNADAYVKWQYNTTNAYLVKKVSDREIIFYTEIAAPWPVSNRDMVVNLAVVQDEKTRVLTIKTNSIPSLLPDKNHLVRVPMSQARWIVTPVSSSRLLVDYFIQIDPGGSVPAWMVNMVSMQAPYDSFRALKELIQQKKFRDSKATFIKDR